MFFGCQDGEIYEDILALMLQRHISPYQQLGKLFSQTCALCSCLLGGQDGEKFKAGLQLHISPCEQLG